MHRVFHEVELNKVQRKNRLDCEAIKRTHTLHSIRGFSNNSVPKTIKLSCFWSLCIIEDHDNCEDIATVNK